MFGFKKVATCPAPKEALPGREQPIRTASEHFINHHALKGPYPEGLETAMFGLGCFWGAERLFWQLEGVWVTAVGYAGGFTPNPTYQETCTGLTGHTEVVLVVYDPKVVSYGDLLKLFWESHDPTQGMRQGNDVGTTYRSAIYTFDRRTIRLAKARRDVRDLAGHARHGAITTEIATRRSSTSPRPITSNTWRRIPTAIAAMAVPACPARSAWA